MITPGELNYYYKVLDLKPGASLDMVDQAYKDLAFIWHPDRIPEENQRLRKIAEEKLKEINQARDKLRSLLRGQAAAKSTQRSSTSSHHRGETYPRSSTNGNGNYSSQSYPRSSANGSGNYSSQSSGRSSANGEGNYAQSYARQPFYSPYQSYQRSSQAAENSTSGKATNSHYSTTSQPPKPSESSQTPTYQPPSQRPDLSGKDFKGADLKEKDFSNRNLSGADLTDANLSDAFLHKVNLSGACLLRANLFRANFLQANLSYANLQEANLIGADLSGADLRGANLTGAKVGSGDRIMVKLTGANLAGAILPDGSVHPN